MFCRNIKTGDMAQLCFNLPFHSVLIHPLYGFSKIIMMLKDYITEPVSEKPEEGTLLQKVWMK